MQIKVAITDDHLMVLKGIESLLSNNREIKITGTFSNAFETLKEFEKEVPDVLLLDINLPDINGIDLSKKLLKKYSNLKIIALTNHEDITYVKRMLKNGVSGYLLKNTDKKELLIALKKVLSGEIYLQESIQKNLLYQTKNNKPDNGLNIKLTRREQEVLLAISNELTTKEISEKLFISIKTVETHRMNIMSKLGAKNSVGIIKNAIDKGLL